MTETNTEALAEKRLEKAKRILDLYFAPWGAAKSERWESEVGTALDPDSVRKKLQAILAGNEDFRL